MNVVVADVTPEPAGSTLILHARGEFDISTVGVLSTALEHAHASGLNVTLECREVAFMDAGTAHVIAASSAALASDGRELRIVNAPPALRKLLVLSKMGGLLAM